MSKAVNFRLDDKLVEPVDHWLEKNHMKLSRLMNLAVQKFIREAQALEPVETIQATNDTVNASMTRMMEQHSDMLDKLR